MPPKKSAAPKKVRAPRKVAKPKVLKEDSQLVDTLVRGYIMVDEVTVNGELYNRMRMQGDKMVNTNQLTRTLVLATLKQHKLKPAKLVAGINRFNDGLLKRLAQAADDILFYMYTFGAGTCKGTSVTFGSLAGPELSGKSASASDKTHMAKQLIGFIGKRLPKILKEENELILEACKHGRDQSPQLVEGTLINAMYAIARDVDPELERMLRDYIRSVGNNVIPSSKFASILNLYIKKHNLDVKIAGKNGRSAYYFQMTPELKRLMPGVDATPNLIIKGADLNRLHAFAGKNETAEAAREAEARLSRINELVAYIGVNKYTSQYTHKKPTMTADQIQMIKDIKASDVYKNDMLAISSRIEELKGTF